MYKRAYSDADIDQILRIAGASADQNVAYSGHSSWFGARCRLNIQGKFFDIQDEPLTKNADGSLIVPRHTEMVSLRSALQFHLEYAAWRYLLTVGKPPSPSDWQKRYKKIRESADKFVQTIERDGGGGPDPLLIAGGLFGLKRNFSSELLSNAYIAARSLSAEAAELEKAQVAALLPRNMRHTPDLRIYMLAAAYCVIWRDILGKGIMASVNPSDGSKGGPLIRFLQASAEPLGLRKSPSQWRGIVNKLKSDFSGLLIST